MRHSLQKKGTIRLLRSQGHSLKEVSSITKVPVTTVWDLTRDIVLTSDAQELLKRRSLDSLFAGRSRVQKEKKEKNAAVAEALREKGIAEIGRLSQREVVIALTALYWAEGFKTDHERRLGFCNSDPRMILFYLLCLEKIGIEKENLLARLTLNSTYKDRVEKFEAYWSELTGIPQAQFSRTFYQTSIWKREYKTDTYRGVLRIHVVGSKELLFKMRGWIEGLKSNLQG